MRSQLDITSLLCIFVFVFVFFFVRVCVSVFVFRFWFWFSFSFFVFVFRFAFVSFSSSFRFVCSFVLVSFLFCCFVSFGSYLIGKVQIIVILIVLCITELKSCFATASSVSERDVFYLYFP